jgi:hypothetical protein
MNSLAIKTESYEMFKQNGNKKVRPIICHKEMSSTEKKCFNLASFLALTFFSSTNVSSFPFPILCISFLRLFIPSK